MYKKSIIKKYCAPIAILICIAFVIIGNGAVPGFGNPDGPISVWVAGLAQSIVNQNLLGIYVTDAGYPNKAPIVFGLPQTYMVAVFMKVGINPSDSYALMVVVFLALAFWGFKSLTKKLNISPGLANLGGVLWLSLPIIRSHEGFGAVVIGLAMLPFYLNAAVIFFESEKKHSGKTTWLAGINYAAVTLLAVFTDGYSFVMHAVGASFLLLYALCKIESKKQAIYFCATHAFALLLAFFLYSTYVGQLDYGRHPLLSFQYYSSALGYIFFPTQGISWAADFFGLSIKRSPITHAGDSVVYSVSFTGPLIIALLLSSSILIFKKTNESSPYRGSFYAMVIFSFWLALGPILKGEPMINDAMAQIGVPPTHPDFKSSSFFFKTGAGWIFENLPGFYTMRATYRWIALASLGCILLILLTINKGWGKYGQVGLMSGLIALYTPNISADWEKNVEMRNSFIRINNAIDMEFSGVFKEGERVLFYPSGNDFLITYIAPKLRIKSFNIGGDKNIVIAQKGWPEYLPKNIIRSWDGVSPEVVEKLLTSSDADAVVIPWFDGLTGIYEWPCAPIPGCFDLAVTASQSLINVLKENENLAVDVHKYFAIIRTRG